MEQQNQPQQNQNLNQAFPDEAKQGKSKKIKIALFALVVAVFAASAVILLLRGAAPEPIAQTPPPAPTLSPQPKIVDISNWQTYRNEEYGFEIKLPSNVYPKDNEQDKWWILIYEEEEDIPEAPIYAADFRIGFVREKQISERDRAVYQQLEDSPTGHEISDGYTSLVKNEDVALDDCVATQYLMKNDSGDNAYMTDCIYRDGRIRLSVLFEEDAPKPELVKEQAKETYDQILSTFRFVPQ